MRTCSLVAVPLLSLGLTACLDTGDAVEPQESTEVSALLAADYNWATGMPNDAIIGGRDSDGAPLYICRGALNGTQPGKTRYDWKGVCDIGYGGGEQWITDSQVLVPTWRSAIYGNLPDNAVAYGKDLNGGSLYVCRANIDGTQQLGKLGNSFDGCYIPYGGQERHMQAYEVLVSSNRLPLKTTSVSNGQIPIDAIRGGRDGDGSTLYPCVASYNGSAQLGKTRDAWKSCVISMGGAENWVSSYSVLTPEFTAAPLNPATRPFPSGSENGQTLGTCQAQYGSSVQVGKYLSSGRCNFGYGGQEVSLTSGFNVLATNVSTTPITYDTGYIYFKDGVPVGGNAKLTVNYDGTYTFTSHFTDTGYPCYHASFGLLLESKSGHGFEWGHKYDMGGSICGGDTTANYDKTDRDPRIQASWADLKAGYQIAWQAKTDININDLLQKIVEEVFTKVVELVIEAA